MARIVLQLPGGRFREHTLGSVTRIGRHPEQDVQVLDPLVSKAHVLIEKIAEEWYLRDLDSRNGTWVNAQRVSGRIRLNDNDRVKVGTTHLVFIMRAERRSGPQVNQVHIGDEATAQLEIAVYRESAQDFLPADLVADEAILKRDYEKLRLAHRMGRQIAADVRLDVLLPRILDHMFALFKADRGVILLVNDKGELAPRSVLIRGREASEESIQLSETILASVVASRTAILARDAQMDPRFEHAHSVISQGIRASMCAPLLGRDGTLMGAIHLDSLVVSNAFTESDLGMLLTLAAQAGVAIENARVVARLERDAVVREQSQRHLAPALAERVVRGDAGLETNRAARPVAVLSFDLRRFSESLDASDPEGTAHQTDTVLERLVEIVFEFEGTLERLNTEGLVAVWGAPFESASAASRAVRCACALQAAVSDLNNRRMLDRLVAISCAAGIDFGPAVCGQVGPTRPPVWAVLGTPMTIARHLGSRARPGETLVSERAWGESSQRLTGTRSGLLTSSDIAGLPEPVVVWTVDSESAMRRPRDSLHTIDSQDLQALTHEAPRPEWRPPK